MEMYEVILEILEKNGPKSIPGICQEMNQLPFYQRSKEKPVLPAHVKSAITRKKELFKVCNNIVFIDPEKNMQSLEVNISGSEGPLLTIRVDFLKDSFSYFEWNFDSPSKSKSSIPPQREFGDIGIFKKEIYRLKLWKWNADYQPETMILDGVCWSVKLVTTGKVYESQGLQQFPKEWTRFSRGLRRLIGLSVI